MASRFLSFLRSYSSLIRLVVATLVFFKWTFSVARLRWRNLGSTPLSSTSALETNQHFEDSDVGCAQPFVFFQRRSLLSLLRSVSYSSWCEQCLQQALKYELR